MKKLLLLIFTCTLVISAYADFQCPYCKGTGKRKVNTFTEGYGVNTGYTRCSYCGENMMDGCHHAHVMCAHCGGTGVIRQSSLGTTSVVSPLDLVSTEGGALFWRNQYGIQVSDEEKKLMSRFLNDSPSAGAAYAQAFETINCWYMGRKRYLTVSGNFKGYRRNSLENEHNAYLTMRQQAYDMINGQYPSYLKSFTTRFFSEADKLHIQYFRTMESFVQVQEAEDKLFDCQLNGLDPRVYFANSTARPLVALPDGWAIPSCKY